VLNGFLKHSPDEVIEFLQKQVDIVPNILNYIHMPYITEFFTHLFSLERNFPKVADWLISQNFISLCLEKLKSDVSIVRENSTNLLEILLNSIRFKPVGTVVLDSKYISEILRLLFDDIGDISSSYYECLTVLIFLLDTMSQSNKIDYNDIVNSIPKFAIVLLVNETKNTSFGTVYKCGRNTLKTIEFISVLLSFNNEAINKKIIENKILQNCIEIFFKCITNNFVHSAVEVLIKIVMERNGGLAFNILKDYGLLDKIYDGYKLYETSQIRGLPCYTGHLLNICLSIQGLGAQNPDIKSFLDGNQKWNEIVSKIDNQMAQRTWIHTATRTRSPNLNLDY